MPSTGLPVVDYAIVAVYLVAVLGAGFWFARFNKGGSDFFVGGNRIPWWAAGISFYMTTFSAWMFTGAASFVYETGWFGWLYFAVKPIGFLIGFQLSAVRWRRARITSPVQFVEARYGRWTRLVLSIVLVLSMMYWPAHHLASVAKISAPALLPDMPEAINVLIVFFGLFVLLYSVAGGIWAVSMTDVLQFLVLFAVCVAVIVAIFSSGDVGSVGDFIASVPTISFEHKLAGGAVYTSWYVWGFLVSSIFGTVVGDKAQRFFLVKDEGEALKTGWMGFGLLIISPLLFGLPPLVGKLLWPDISMLTAFAGTNRPEEAVFIAVVMKYMPLGIAGLFIAAMIAASMSALDSVWNTVSSIVSIDLYKGHINANASEADLLRVGRWTTIFLAVAAIGMALLIVNSQLGIFTISNMVLGLIGIPVTIPLLVGILTRVPTRTSAIPAILTGIGISFISRFELDWTLGPQYLVVIGATFSSLFVSRLLTKIQAPSSVAVLILRSVGALVFAASICGVLWLWDAPRMSEAATVTVLSPLTWSILVAIAVLHALMSFRPDETEGTSEDNLNAFFERLRTPINVAQELGPDEGIARPNELVSKVTLALAAIPALLWITTGFQFTVLYGTVFITFLVFWKLFR